MVNDDDSSNVGEGTTTSGSFECPVCLRLLVEPVTTACGHTFCKYCIRKSMDHRQLCPTCRAPCPFIGNTNVMIANLIQQQFPEEYATRLDEVNELEAQEESSNSADANSTTDHGVFFPFIKLPIDVVLYPYGNRLACNVEPMEADVARGIWRGGAARSVVIEMEDTSEQQSYAVLGEIVQIRGNRVVVIGRGRVSSIGNNEIYTNTSGIRVKKYAATSPIKDITQQAGENANIINLATDCLSLIYDNRLPRVGEMGLRKFNHLHGDRRRPSRAQLEAMSPLEFEKLSFWLCSCLKAPSTLRFQWLRSRDTLARLQSIKDYIDNAGASQIINLEEDAAGGSPGLFRGISWSFGLLLAVFVALFLKYSGWLDNRYGGYLIG